MFDRFIVDKTHGVLVFNHSFDELSFSQSLCRIGKESSTGVNKETGCMMYSVQRSRELI